MPAGDSLPSPGAHHRFFDLMPSILFSMLGAREHYAPVIMAERAGWLDSFVTDFWSPPSSFSSSLARLGLTLPARAAGRYTQEVPTRKVHALRRVGIEYKWSLARAGNRAAQYAVFEKMGRRFATETCSFLSAGHDGFFGFSSASLETLRHAAQLGIHGTLNQIDPSRVEYDLVAEEERNFPRLAARETMVPESYFVRIQEEWESASAVVVNSDWSRDALERQGVPAAKLYVAPLAFKPISNARAREPWKRELRVLWLGTLCLRKGLPYAIEAARQLEKDPVRFTFAGPCDVQISNLNFPANSTYLGPVTRDNATRLYSEHDVFIFPTLSDGFGLTQVEAIAHGLPVITTKCCGSVVEHGRSGMVIPSRDVAALVEAIREFVDARELLPRMSTEALKRSADFGLDQVWPRYAAAISSARDLAIRSPR